MSEQHHSPSAPEGFFTPTPSQTTPSPTQNAPEENASQQWGQMTPEQEKKAYTLTPEGQLAWQEHYAHVPGEMWSQLEQDSIRSALYSYNMIGKFTNLFTIKGERQMSLEATPKVPKELRGAYDRNCSAPRPVYVVTEQESWWPGPHAFRADTRTGAYLRTLYEYILRTKDLDVLKHYPHEKRAPGRPADPAVQARKEKEREYAEAYNEWAKACRERKERIAAAENAYREAMMGVEVLKQAWRKAETEPVPPRPVA